MSLPRRSALCLWLGLLLVVSTRAAESVARSPAALAAEASVLAFATAQAIPMDRIEIDPAGGEGRNGDAVTALIAFQDGKRKRQWLTRFIVATPTPKEKEGRTAAATITIANVAHKFSSKEPVALEIRTVGPFVAGDKKAPDDKHARALLTPAFLALGFTPACEAMLAAAAEAKVKGAEVEMKPEDGRAIAGLLLAMMEFFQAAQSTPGLKEILFDVMDKPSIWSLVKSGGKIQPGFVIGDTFPVERAEWRLADGRCYGLPLTIKIKEQPALRCVFFVTNPRPPLLTTAGIVGIAAESPSEPARRVDIRVLAAQRGAAATPPAGR